MEISPQRESLEEVFLRLTQEARSGNQLRSSDQS